MIGSMPIAAGPVSARHWRHRLAALVDEGTFIRPDRRSSVVHGPIVEQPRRGFWRLLSGADTRIALIGGRSGEPQTPIAPNPAVELPRRRLRSVARAAVSRVIVVRDHLKEPKP